MSPEDDKQIHCVTTADGRFLCLLCSRSSQTIVKSWKAHIKAASHQDELSKLLKRLRKPIKSTPNHPAPASKRPRVERSEDPLDQFGGSPEYEPSTSSNKRKRKSPPSPPSPAPPPESTASHSPVRRGQLKPQVVIHPPHRKYKPAARVKQEVSPDLGFFNQDSQQTPPPRFTESSDRGFTVESPHRPPTTAKPSLKKQKPALISHPSPPPQSEILSFLASCSPPLPAILETTVFTPLYVLTTADLLILAKLSEKSKITFFAKAEAKGLKPLEEMVIRDALDTLVEG